MARAKARGKTPKLKNPPVIEVLVEIRVEPTQPFSIIPGAFHERIKDRYGKLELLPLAQFGTENLPPHLVHTVSHRFRSEKGPYLVQVGPNVCTVNAVRPYAGFEHFQREVRRNFREYRLVSGFKKIARIGLRYINRIPVLPATRWSEIVNFEFKLANGQIKPKEAMLRSIVEEPKIGSMNLLVSTDRLSGKDAAPSILLDIDVYSTDMARITKNYFGWLSNAHQFAYQSFRQMVNPYYLRRLEKTDRNHG